MIVANIVDWKIKKVVPKEFYAVNRFYECNNSYYAIYFSNIVEWSMMKYCANIEIYADKDSPKKIFANKSVWFLFSPSEETKYVYDWTKNKLLCLIQQLSLGDNHYGFSYTIINLETLKFTSIRGKSFTFLINKDINTITGIKKIIDKGSNKENEMIEDFLLDKMEWVDLDKLSDE